MINDSVQTKPPIANKLRLGRLLIPAAGNYVIYSILGLILVNISLIAWSYYDHALPVYDMASHLLSGINCCELLAHPHLRSITWWRQLFAVNPLYPPFVYFVYGFFNLVLGQHRWVDLLVRLLFSNLLFISIYASANLIFEKFSTALVSACIIFVYPAVFIFANHDMLDLPGLAMVSFSLFCFTKWQQEPSLRASFVLGVACALTALTKNNSIAFLITPLVMAFVGCIIKRDWVKIKTLVLAGSISVIIMLPWLLLAYPAMAKIINGFQKHSHEIGADFQFTDNLYCYLTHLTGMFSPLLLGIFLLAFSFSTFQTHRRMVYISLSAIGGFLLLSSFYWAPLSRYLLPITIPIALYSANGMVSLWGKKRLRPILSVISILLVFSFFELAFTPYPFPRIHMPNYVETFLGIVPGRTGQHYEPGGCSSSPTPQSDWGHSWVLKTIASYPRTVQENFGILPDGDEVNPATYIYLAKVNHLQLQVFTPRNCTLMGDEMGFDKENAKYVRWYLLKTGDPGSSFANSASKKAYDDWCALVRKSGYYKLVGIKVLPDGNQLELYRNVKY